MGVEVKPFLKKEETDFFEISGGKAVNTWSMKYTHRKLRRGSGNNSEHYNLQSVGSILH